MSNSHGQGTACVHNLEDKDENHKKQEDQEEKAVLLLKTIIAAESLIYVATNARLLYKWVTNLRLRNALVVNQGTHGKFKSIVNKLMGLNRVCGVFYVTVLGFESILITDNVAEEHRVLYCNSINFLLNFSALFFWVNQFMVAIIRGVE